MPIVHAKAGGEKGVKGGQFTPTKNSTSSPQKTQPQSVQSTTIEPQDLPIPDDEPLDDPQSIQSDDLPGPRINPKASNEEIRNFLEEQPLAKPTTIPIEGALLIKIMGKLDYWKRAEPQEYEQVIRITKLEEIPPPIVQYYSNGNVGIPDGFHRIAAYYLLGRTKILGYRLDGRGRSI